MTLFTLHRAVASVKPVWQRADSSVWVDVIFLYCLGGVCIVCPRYALLNYQRLCWCQVESSWTLQLLCKLFITWLMALLKNTRFFFPKLFLFLNLVLICILQHIKPTFLSFSTLLFSVFILFLSEVGRFRRALSRVLKSSSTSFFRKFPSRFSVL